MPGLINEHRYETDKSEICEQNPSAADAFDAIEWFLLRSTFNDLPLLVAEGGRSFRYVTSESDVRIAPQIMVVLGEEHGGGENKIVLLAAHIVGEQADGDPQE